ncbi:MAG: hypothetical protein ACRDIY_18020 [Chloroflexota bacterium]
MADLNTQFVYGPHHISADLTLTVLFEQLPAALPFMVGLGFTPLAEPLLRERYATRVTIRQAAATLPINLERLLIDLDHLAETAGQS